jgi:hypothetical protein
MNTSAPPVPVTITINCDPIDAARIRAVLEEAANNGMIRYPFECRIDTPEDSQALALRYSRP